MRQSLRCLILLISLFLTGCFQAETPTVISTFTHTPPAAETTEDPQISANTVMPTATWSLGVITDTPWPLITHTPLPVATGTSLPTLTATPDSVTLNLMVDMDTLTLYVAAPENLYLGGLELRVKDQASDIQVVNIPERFDILDLTNGYAQPGSCFVLRKAGTDSPLPDSCTQPNRIFRYDVARADVFWYDPLQNIQRDIVVMNHDELVATCSAVLPNCPIKWHVSPPVPG